MKKELFMVGALLLSAMSYTSCTLDNEEPAGITELRGAKSEWFKAEAALKLAEAAYKTAEIEMVNAQVQYQLIQNKIYEISLKQKELQYELEKAQSEVTKADYANQIAALEQTKKEAALAHEQRMLTLQKSLADAQKVYDQALYDLEAAAIGRDETTRAAIATLKGEIETSMGKINTAYLAIMKNEKAITELKLAGEDLKDVLEDQKSRDLAEAKEKAANLEEQIATVEGVIDGFADVSAEIETQEELIKTSVAQYNADKKELQKLVDDKDADEKALEKTQWDYKKAWVAKQEFATAAGIDATLANKLIKKLFTTPTAEQERVLGLKYVVEEGEKIYSFDNADNKAVFIIPEYNVTEDQFGNTTITFKNYNLTPISPLYLETFSVSNSSLHELKDYIYEARKSAAAIVEGIITPFSDGNWDITAVNLEIFEGELNKSIKANDKAMATQKDATETGSYAKAAKEYADALADYIEDPSDAANVANLNTWGRALYGTYATYGTTHYWETIYANYPVPTKFVAKVSDEVEKEMKGIDPTLYSGLWRTMYSLELKEAQLDLAEAAKNLYVELDEKLTALDAECHALAQKEEIDAATYAAAKDAIEDKYNSDIYELSVKVGSIPTAGATVTEVEIEKSKTSDGLLNISAISGAGDDAALIDKYIEIYNALVNGANLASYETLLATLQNDLETAREAVADAQTAYDELVANGDKDSTGKYRDVAIKEKEQDTEKQNAIIEKEKKNIESYQAQVDAYIALFSADAAE